MPKIFPVIKKATAIVAGAINASAQFRLAFRFTPIIRAIGAKVNTGIRVATAPVRVVTAKRPALRFTAFGIGSPAKVNKRPALRILQTMVNLTHRTGATAQTTTGASWTTPANAVGRRNGTNASVADNNALAAIAVHTMTLDFNDFTGKTGLTIRTVRIWEFSQHAPGLTATSAAIRYRTAAGGALTDLQALSQAAWNNLVNGRSFDISAAIGQDWTRLNNLQVVFEFRDDQLAGAGTGTLNIDAVELEVIADRTEVL